MPLLLSGMGVLELLDGATLVDLLLVDIVLQQGMPHGISVAAMVRFRRPKLPVVFITGYQQYAALVRKEDNVLLKPISREELLQAVLASQVGR